MKVHVGM